jgi:hypothetical protein
MATVGERGCIALCIVQSEVRDNAGTDAARKCIICPQQQILHVVGCVAPGNSKLFVLALFTSLSSISAFPTKHYGSF